MTLPRARYYVERDHQFVVDNYNWAKPFSNFFPGIAGKWGIPLWIYYVSKAQAVCSLGVHDKDHAILEFLSFNKACQTVGREGFRTFVKLNGAHVYEPFQRVENEAIAQRMIVSSHELELHEHNAELGLETSVVYFPLVNMPLAGLIRLVTIKNVTQETRDAEVIDGVARVLPYGVTFDHVKVIARHIEGMMGVLDVEGVPLFRLKQTPGDIEEVGKIEAGHFYCSLVDGEKAPPRSFIVDPAVLFGEAENHDFPWVLAHESVDTILDANQIRETRTPCAFTALTRSIPPGETVTVCSVIGATANEQTLKEFLPVLEMRDFVLQKRAENREVIDQIENFAFTVSSEPVFDQYCQQTFLDNVMRGGMPVTFESADNKHLFYIYSRQGGDLERDYHWIVLEPTYLSQGNGHYRSILQNRRMDTWFFPEAEDYNLITFLNLTQTDGYNPLTVNGITFVADDVEGMKKWLGDLVPDEATRDDLLALVTRPFTPGQFIMALEASATSSAERSYDEILADLLPLCRQGEIGALHEGYWIDHWFYNLDLLDTFLMVYPDRLREILLEKKVYTFYDNPDVVQSRAEKTVLVNGRVRQYGAVVRDPEKQEMIRSRAKDPCRVRTRFGEGEVYSTNLLGKLLCIIANKIAALDPEGIGIEMEAGKPGWCDSLNGLPGLFGSSLCETLELVRACRFLLNGLSGDDFTDSEPLPLFEELYTFISGLNLAIEKRLASVEPAGAFVFWDESHTLKETFRVATRPGIRGQEQPMSLGQVKGFLQNCLCLLEATFDSTPRGGLFHDTGVPYTYFINEATDYSPLLDDLGDQLKSEAGYPLVEARGFKQAPLALFLEGPVHWLRIFSEQAGPIFEAVKHSRLYDTQLQMYKCCESLEQEPFEIGRIKSYARGWIENESIYTHMEYKWLLELLRGGLHEEFFEEVRHTLPPFLDPAMYGRSTLENCSFIVSSAFPDVKLHGQAFQPRQSGVTCEMLQIWTIMVAGERPFFLDENRRLRLRLQPVLSGWLFTTAEGAYRYWDDEDGSTDVLVPENCFAFKFIGRTLVVYHNEGRKATFGMDGAQAAAYTLTFADGTTRLVTGNSLGLSLATDVREGRVRRMDVILS